MAVGIIFLIFIIFSPTNLVNGQVKPKIVVVGAGLSGMAAATKLIENGYRDIVILEAENRIGGRTHSVKFSDGFVDLGAQWVHGAKNNSVYEIVDKRYKFGVTGFDDKLPVFVQSDGTYPDQKKCEDFSFLALETLFSSYDKMSKFDGSIGAFFSENFKNSTEYRSDGDRDLGDEMIDYFEKEMNIWNGSETWNDLSARLHCISGFNEGLQYLTWKRDGYKEFFRYLTKENATDNSGRKLNVLGKILLKQEVTNIEWNNPRYDYRYAFVKVNNLRTYYADHVIVTVPLGVLKDRHKTMFTPGLPRTLKRAINAVGFGNIGKIFLEFDMPFWPNDTEWVGYGFLWTKEDKAKVMGTDKEWLLDLQAFTKVDQYPNVIEALLAGYHMRMFENLSTEKIINDCMWLLEKFLNGVLPKPKSMIKTGWLTNRNFLGSYSYMSMKAAASNITTTHLAATLYNIKSSPQVIFAGEHTDDMYSSNAHGAVNSGFRAAQEIIDFYS